MLTAARCWPQGWLVVRTMSQDLIGCWNQRKFESAYSSRGCREWFAIGGEKDRFCRLFFIVLWSYGRKICLNMCHDNSENSDGCSYLFRICFICETNVIVSRSWIPPQVVDREQGAFWFTNNQNQYTKMQIKILSIFKLVSFESLAGNDFSERAGYASGGSLWKKPRSPTVKYLTINIASLFKEFSFWHYYKSWWLKVTDSWLFAFAFSVKNKPGKVSSLAGCLLLFWLKIGENCRGKY